MPYPMHEFIPSLFGLAVTIFWIWMLIDCARNPRLRSGAKAIWLLIIIFLHLIGALIYFFTARVRNQSTFFPPRTQQYSGPYQQPPLYRQPNQPPVYYQPPSPAQEPYREYEQGYGAAPVQRQQREAGETANWQHYEEPQSLYPQLPKQELPPQEQQES